jgi:hypothetical protein
VRGAIPSPAKGNPLTKRTFNASATMLAFSGLALAGVGAGSGVAQALPGTGQLVANINPSDPAAEFVKVTAVEIFDQLERTQIP